MGAGAYSPPEGWLIISWWEYGHLCVWATIAHQHGNLQSQSLRSQVGFYCRLHPMAIFHATVSWHRSSSRGLICHKHQQLYVQTTYAMAAELKYCHWVWSTTDQNLCTTNIWYCMVHIQLYFLAESWKDGGNSRAFWPHSQGNEWIPWPPHLTII